MQIPSANLASLDSQPQPLFFVNYYSFIQILSDIQ